MTEFLDQDSVASSSGGIHRDSPVPLYHQLAKHLENRIRSGGFRADERFPTEAELASEFRLSRPTVRQALDGLVNRGFLVRERGRGTFVRPIVAGPVAESKIIRYHRLGLVMPWGPGTFFAPLLEVVEDIAHQTGFHAILVNNRENPEIEMAKLRELLKHGVDGLLWMCPSGGPNEAFARTVLKTVPVVVAIDRAVSLPDVQMSTVEADNRGGMREVVRYLIGRGRRRIAFIREPLRVSSAEERYQGYRDALTEAGLPVNNDGVFSSRQCFYENGRLCAEKLLKSSLNFDAVACHTDTTAVGVLHYLAEKGVRVPDDIAVTGFNDDPTTATVVQPKLTTGRINVPEMGRQAVRLLLEQLERLDRGLAANVTHVSVPVDLVVRESA